MVLVFINQIDKCQLVWMHGKNINILNNNIKPSEFRTRVVQQLNNLLQVEKENKSFLEHPSDNYQSGLLQISSLMLGHDHMAEHHGVEGALKQMWEFNSLMKLSLKGIGQYILTVNAHVASRGRAANLEEATLVAVRWMFQEDLQRRWDNIVCLLNLKRVIELLNNSGSEFRWLNVVVEDIYVLKNSRSSCIFSLNTSSRLSSSLLAKFAIKG
ncbi:katanin p60 ATPase-containing subunit [Striga asiatica]|uniref:Katanin p60 ATPase-containing subunit n=1 Tax=Striga asiatica TaxID=4170 RepID=A0A5A7Q2R3_STRAF|nr:katanin p60 ATPase-containing subunit [Striga asiatica]